MLAEARTVHTMDRYKANMVLLAYLQETEGNESIPLLDNLIYQVRRHFRQEFATEVQSKERYHTFGAEDEAKFLMLLHTGRMDRYMPSNEEIVDILDVFGLAHIDWQEHAYAYNSPVQEVW